jgi:hypothetical protein
MASKRGPLSCPVNSTLSLLTQAFPGTDRDLSVGENQALWELRVGSGEQIEASFLGWAGTEDCHLTSPLK